MGTQRVSIRYGPGVKTLEIPDERFAGSWSFRDAPRSSGSDPFAEAARELRAAGLSRAIQGVRVALLLPDGTRAWEPRTTLERLWPLLEGAAQVDLFLCTGTHDPLSAVNRELMKEVQASCASAPLAVEVVMHDSRSHAFDDFGSTSRGTPVRVSRRLARSSVLLCVADVKPHYFAGYSNPIKYVVPGLAAYETVRANHAFALESEAAAGRHPWHPDPTRRSNPLAEDLLEAFERVVGDRAHFALTSLREKDRLFGAWGGTTREAFERAVATVDERCGFALDPVRFLVVSPGGAPHDESLYTAQRALELTVQAWLPGGEVLFMAQCGDGIGPPGARENFFEALFRPLDEIQAVPRHEYVLYGHKPVKLARLLERASALWILSELPEDELRRAHFRPVRDPQSVIDDWVRRAGSADRIACVDDASRLLAHRNETRG